MYQIGNLEIAAEMYYNRGPMTLPGGGEGLSSTEKKKSKTIILTGVYFGKKLGK